MDLPRVSSAARRVRRIGSNRLERIGLNHPALSGRVLPVSERIRSVTARVTRHRPQRALERVVFEFTRSTPDATFVQVGAHDGTQLDPLRRAILGSRWRGVMVEPVPYVFERLEARYGWNGRVILENVAISDCDGSREFYYLAQADSGERIWRWYDALGSFDRDVILSHEKFIADIGSRIVSIDVPCFTFTTLCDKHGLDHVDLVQIDTEGYDREILELIDFDRLRTDVVMFEHLHLGADGRDACRELLTRHGFEQVSDGMDTLALTPHALAHPGVRREFHAAQADLANFEQ